VSEPSQVIKLGVIGLGRAFTLMLPTFQQDARVSLVAACDPRLEARTQFEKDFHAPACADVESLARNPAVDVVYVASPHQYHAEHVRTVARHGKHVLVEKPMALSLADCDAMIADCRAAGVKLLVGHSHSFDEPYRVTRSIIAAGSVGAVRMIHALNYTDFLYRPRRAEELDAATGGGVVFNQAAHQVDVVRLLAGSDVERVRAMTGAWDAARPVDGAYTALLWFASGAFASLTYSGFAHFDSDEWCNWTGEMGHSKNANDYGAARKRLKKRLKNCLANVPATDAERELKAASIYGGAGYTAVNVANPAAHQHFGSIIVSCDRADLRPLPDAVWIYGNDKRERIDLPAPLLPRFEVIDELYAAIVDGQATLHDGAWARVTLEVCLAIRQSAKEQRDVQLS